MARRRGRDGRALPTVDPSSEYLEVERRRLHEEIRREKAREQARRETRSQAGLAEELDRLGETPGWRVTRKGGDR